MGVLRRGSTKVKFPGVRRLIPTYFALLAGAVLLMLPFLWMVSTALKTPETSVQAPFRWIPSPPMWSNFRDGWTAEPFAHYFFNTVTITGTVIAGTLLTASMAAFSFSRLRWPGRNLVFFATLTTMMLPAQVTLIPIFLMFKDLGWLNTYRPLTIGAWLGGGAVNIFLLRQFMLTIPLELEDAARIDGCTSFGVYWRVVMPLSKTCLAMVAIFTFLGTWNDFMGPLIYLSTPDKSTLALGLQFFQGRYGVVLPYLMAVSLIVMAPCLLLFLSCQKLFTEGLTLGSVKG
jgi:ABC-type glycerol-3-phosphate transport system permease component